MVAFEQMAAKLGVQTGEIVGTPVDLLEWHVAEGIHSEMPENNLQHGHRLGKKLFTDQEETLILPKYSEVIRDVINVNPSGKI